MKRWHATDEAASVQVISELAVDVILGRYTFFFLLVIRFYDRRYLKRKVINKQKKVRLEKWLVLDEMGGRSFYVSQNVIDEATVKGGGWRAIHLFSPSHITTTDLRVCVVVGG